MNPLQLMKLITFILANGQDVMEQINALIKFAQDLADKYNGDTMTTMAIVDDMGHPIIAKGCDEFQELKAVETGFAEGQSGAMAIGTRGIFKDLIKDIIADPQKYIDLFLKIKDMFGLEEKPTPAAA